MGLIELIAALIAYAVAPAVAIALDRRPYRPGKLDYLPLMIVSLAACFLPGRHPLA
jgi:hypothetical protein